MPKGKLVRHATPFPSTPYSPATRRLSTMEKATSWVDDEGMISLEQGIDRVFRAAVVGGSFKVNRKIKGGVMDTLVYRDYPKAMAVTVGLILRGERPMLYAATHNRDSMIAGTAHKDAATGRFVSKNEATADVLQHFLDVYCEMKGIKHRPAPMLDALRPRKRKPRVRIT